MFRPHPSLPVRLTEQWIEVLSVTDTKRMYVISTNGMNMRGSQDCATGVTLEKIQCSDFGVTFYVLVILAGLNHSEVIISAEKVIYLALFRKVELRPMGARGALKLG
jgi:hypothetical protein